MNEFEWRIDQFKFMYHCSAKIEDHHHICLNCMYSIIKQSEELSGLLTEILSGECDINNDCIEVIVKFVVGECVKIMGDKMISKQFTKFIRNILNCLPVMKGSMNDFYIHKIGMEVIEDNDDKIIYGFKHNENYDIMIRSNPLIIIQEMMLIGN